MPEFRRLRRSAREALFCCALLALLATVAFPFYWMVETSMDTVARLLHVLARLPAAELCHGRFPRRLPGDADWPLAVEFVRRVGRLDGARARGRRVRRLRAVALPLSRQEGARARRADDADDAAARP